jgi:hypothetical protein
MKECLHCKKEFEPKRKNGKYCSANCRVSYFREHGKKDVMSPNLLQAVFNQVLETLSEIKKQHTPITQPTHIYIPQNEHITVSYKEPQKIRRSYDWYRQARIDCTSNDDWAELRQMIEADEFLTDNQKFNLTKKAVQ